MPEKSAWLTIWTSPRETIRRILSDNPKHGLWRLATIYGFVSLLGAFQSFSKGSHVELWVIFFASLIFAPIWGYILFSVWSGVMTWVGHLFKGNGDFQGIRAAYAWSCLPVLVNAALWIVMIVLFGSVLFIEGGTTFHTFPEGMGILLAVLLLGKVIMSIWSLVIYLNALAEVQQFSILRAIGNIVVSGIVFGIAIGILIFIGLYLIGLGAEEARVTTSAMFQVLHTKLIYTA